MDDLRNALTKALTRPPTPAGTSAPAADAASPDGGSPADGGPPADPKAAARAALKVSAPAAPKGPILPDPLASEWVAAMRRLRVEVPRDPSMGQLTQRSDAACRQMEAEGRKRDARELRALKEGFLAQREKAAWALVKSRFEELALSEKSYRALKQEGALPEKVLEAVWGRRGEALRGAGHARLKEALLPR